ITSADITLESYWLVADSCRNRSDWSDAELINTLELGSLTEDLDTLRKHVLINDVPLATYLRQLSHLLYGLAQTIEQSAAKNGG
ncbi:MAG: hypothetical protein ACRCZF_27765, partial [Gemmataceae bacterium]